MPEGQCGVNLATHFSSDEYCSVQAILEIDAAGAAAALTPVLGRSAVQRHVHRLRSLGCEGFGVRFVGVDAGARTNWLARAHRQLQSVGAGQPPRLAEVEECGDTPAIVVRGDAVFDPRLYEAVSASATALCLTDAGAPIGIARWEAGHGPTPGVSVFRTFAQDNGCALQRDIAELPTYIPALRRDLTPYWSPVREAAQRRRAGTLILDAAQKGVLDFPARFLHPWPENRLVEWAARGSITPNQITLISAAIGFLGTYAFATQRFGLGLLCAVVAGILDGVDGKLARVKLLSSRFGDRLDHTLDVTFEFSWYIALGWGLAATGVPQAVATGFAIIAVMVAARALSGVYLLLTGRQIHDHTAFDRAVRLVAGRRNIYVLVLVCGFMIDTLPQAFTLVLWWGIATVTVYLVRIGVAWVGRRSGAEVAGQPAD